jgi:hypothetical protein
MLAISPNCDAVTLAEGAHLPIGHWDEMFLLLKKEIERMAHESFTKSMMAARLDFWPIHGRTPVSPAIFHSIY